MRCPACGTERAALQPSCGHCGQTFETDGDLPTEAPLPLDTIARSDVAEQTTQSPTTHVPGGRPASGPPTRALLRPGETFGARYTITRLLGEGGMGAVYEAMDRELGVPVALKVIRPEITADPLAAAALERRFKRELLLARQVTHPNVVRIYDLGEVDGTKYISMSYIDGEDLATILRRERVLPPARALRIARCIASGLQAAHKAGVVHRDLKPANVMIDAGGEALIMDFGIARSRGAGEADGSRPATKRALASAVFDTTRGDAIVGTVPYMAPEQTTGEADERTDIYAFGLIMYDMLTAKRREAWGKDAYSELMARMESEPVPLGTVETHVPPSLSRIIARCVRPDPAERYQTTAELVADLDRLDEAGRPLPVVRRVTRRQLMASAAVVTALLAATWWWAAWWATPPVEPPPVSVLIADFENRTGEDVFNGVLEEAVGVGIEGASFINVFPRNEARLLLRQVAATDRLDLERARILAQREGIRVVIDGSIVREGSRYRLTVRALDPVPGTPLSTLTGTAANRDDVLNVVADLGSEVRTALGDTTPESARLSERETFTAASVEAAGVYWQAQELLNNAKYAESIPYFRRATELDPTFARAYANWAISEFYLGRRDQAETLYKRAFSLSDRMTEREKYRTYGSYYLTVAQAYDHAIENYEKLVQLYPADRAGHGNLAVAYFYTLNFAKTFEEGRRALELFPGSLKLRTNYALYAMYAGDFATAAREAEQVLKTDPMYYQAYVPLAIAAFDRGALADARGAYERMAAIGGPAGSRAAMGLADLELYQGNDVAAAGVLLPAVAEDEKTGNRTGRAAKYIALAEAYRGEGRGQDAIVATRQALATNRHESVLLAAARVLLSLGREAEVKRLAAELEKAIGGYSRPYARLLEAELALARGDPAESVEHLLAGQKLADLWMFHFLLGQAYVRAERYPEALAELELAVKRRGEATAIFLDDVPSFRYLAPLPYWLGRAQEGVGLTVRAAESYQRFLALRSGRTDRLAADARQRVAKLTS